MYTYYYTHTRIYIYLYVYLYLRIEHDVYSSLVFTSSVQHSESQKLRQATMQGNFTNMKHRSDRDRQCVLAKCLWRRWLLHAYPLSRTNGSQRSHTNSHLDAGYFFLASRFCVIWTYMDPGQGT